MEHTAAVKLDQVHEVQADLQPRHQLGCAAWQVYWLVAHLQPAQLQGAPGRLQPHAGLSWGQPPDPGHVHQGLSHQARQQAPVQMESSVELQQQLMYLMIIRQGLLSITTVAYANT